MTIGYNPDFNPTGIEGGIDTNLVPWIELSQAPGMSIKPLRASSESGMFTVVARVKKGTRLGELVHLGAMDMLVLSGSMTYAQGADGRDSASRHLGVRSGQCEDRGPECKCGR